MNRRQLLISGGASLVVLGAAANGLHSNLRSARRPWSVSGGEFTDPRLTALSYAVLAPSPHNRQPWLAELSGTRDLVIYCDTDRLLPETDPFNRQITIGLGAFTELLRMAARYQGFDLEVDYFPEGEPQPVLNDRPIAKIRFRENAEIKPDSLFAYVLARRTNRTNFDDVLVKPEVLERMSASIEDRQDTQFGYTLDPDEIEALKDICIKAWHIEMSTPRTHHESTRLTRVGEGAINAAPDGISLSGPLMEALKIAGQMSEEKMNAPASQAFKGTRKFYSELIETARAFAWITTRDNTRLSQVEAGEDWLRLHMAATREGLAFQPLSQALQEFPEMSGPYADIHRRLGAPAPRTVQGLFRLGYAPAPPPSPRWPLRSRLVEMKA